MKRSQAAKQNELDGTIYLLGAGASYASPAPEARLPLQQGFFAHIGKSGFGPLLAEIFRLMSYSPLAEWLIANGYGDEARPYRRLGTDWDLNIEDFYSQIEADPVLGFSRRSQCLKLLDKIVFASVSMPTEALRNSPERACPYHRSLAEQLLPGDTIVSFNYDSLVDDALLAFCPHWHPLTGYGIQFDDVLGGTLSGKQFILDSDVTLLKPHGSVTFSYL